MKVLVTGGHGFMGMNLVVQLQTRDKADVRPVGRETGPEALRDAIGQVDFICHLAGVNRTVDVDDFERVNVDMTRAVCDAVAKSGRRIPIVFTSSVHAERDSPYGLSKRSAEQILIQHMETTGAPVHIFRLPNVFGKWSRPNYNSAVATFSHNIARDLPITINDPAAPLTLVYVDDVIAAIRGIVTGVTPAGQYCHVSPTYDTTVGAVATTIAGFRASRSSLTTDRVGEGLARALYATYLSYLSPSQFAYPLHKHADPRGMFVEMLKTPDSGQVSYFTAHPGITRGGHYHHTKNEKFLVVQGRARFRFRSIVTGEYHELNTSGADPQIVEAVPGWTHDVTNIGDEELIVMSWANEVFDPQQSDTYPRAV